MQNRRRPQRTPPQGYQVLLVIILIAFAGLITAGIVMGLTLQPISVDPSRVFVSPAPVQTYTTYAIPQTTTSLATTTTTAAPTTTTPVPTTVPIPPIGIVCPDDTEVALGKPYDISVTGNALATGGCDSGGPIVTHTDVLVGSIARKSHPRSSPHYHVEELEERGTIIKSIRGETRKYARKASAPSWWESWFLPSPQKKSPSFDAPNIRIISSEQFSDTGSAVSQSNGEYVLTLYSSPDGSVATVQDTNLTSILAQFQLNTLGFDNCSFTGGQQPQVEWDSFQNRWLMLEIAANERSLCLYTSDTTDPLGSWTQHEYLFDEFPNYPKIGVWNSTLALTLNTVNSSLCVINNLNLTQMVCGTPFGGQLPAFGLFQSWTPLGVTPLSGLPFETETAASPSNGAVFMRHYDEEMHRPGFVGNSATFDYINVEHWNNVRFSTGFFARLRYSIQMMDFDSSYGVNVTTPAGGPQIDPLREIIMHRLSYRFLPHCNNQGSVTGTFTARTTNQTHVRWFELRWEQPTPITAPVWTLHQEGILNHTTSHLWLGTAAMDSNGTIAIGYAASNSQSQYPSLYVTTRVGNDPLGKTRQPALLVSAGTGNPPLSSPPPQANSMTSTEWREFYFSGQSGSNPWSGSTTKLRVSGEIIQRIFIAQDTCYDPFATCTQVIRMT